MNLIGQTLGKYQIVELIGKGGMATVYKAYQPGLDRYVAVKVVSAQQIPIPGLKERFIREAKAVAQLSHPNILPIYDVGLEGDISYFVMKYVVGGRTLRDLMGQPMDLPTVSHYIDQAGRALDHAHERGILHRDVKPTNMLLEGDWLLLADFGLAKIAEGDVALTGTGMVMGTPAYVSPEQAESKLVDHRTDIYSLGIVLYEMVTGQVPYKGGMPVGVIVKHITEPLPPPRHLKPDLPETVEQIILKAVAKAPADRYDRAGELAEALRAQLCPSGVAMSPTMATQLTHLFISYRHNVEPDQQVANYLYEYLTTRGHNVFIDRTLRTGETWLEEIDRQIKGSDFLVALLSKESSDSEVVQAEVRRAYEYRKRQGRPHILPVRIAYEGLLPYSIDAFLDPLQYVTWQSEADNERVGHEILAAIAGRLPRHSPIEASPVDTEITYSEDGRPITGDESLVPPLPEFDPRFLETLEAPGGAVKLRDRFYIKREADPHLKRQVVKSGTITTIRASRQTGKSSLLVRGVHHARQHGAKIVNFDLQRVAKDHLKTPDTFLHYLAEFIVRKLRLDMAELEKLWHGSLGPQDKLTYLMEDYVLPQSDIPIVLAMDEVDRLLHTTFHNDFFGLLRSWHNSAAYDKQWEKLNLVMVISTEPYLLIADVNQSPFNIGLKLHLKDFNEDQVRDLNQRHGSPVQDGDFPQLMELLNGHPYLTRKALYTLVAERLTWADLIRIAPTNQGPFDDHLRHCYWLLRDEGDLREALKQVIDQNRCPDEMALFRLLRAGLVKGGGDSCTCRCDLYRMYFQEKLS
jgi:serine/threonine protein kinase